MRINCNSSFPFLKSNLIRAKILTWFCKTKYGISLAIGGIMTRTRHSMTRRSNLCLNNCQIISRIPYTLVFCFHNFYAHSIPSLGL